MLKLAGIEVNPEAAKISAFSLYLSMLHYLEPKDIHKQMKMGNRLPNLVASDKHLPNHFHCILPLNAFDTKQIDANRDWKERFSPGCADVIVGNPPWGAPGKKAAPIAKERHKIMIDWCKHDKHPIGDAEASQAFIWRALDLLKENGIESEIIEMEGSNVFSKMFLSITLADWASYYLALLYGQDPTPVAMVEKLKKILA